MLPRAADCRRAAAEYRECLKQEPGNAGARAGLANVLLFRSVLGDLGRDEAAPRARALLEEAGRTDHACPDIHLSRSRLLCLADWEWERAQEEVQRAFELASDDETRHVARAWRGFHLVERGEMEKGLEQLRRASSGCPLSPFVSRFLAEAHYLARDFSGCAAVSGKALELHPHCWPLHRSLGKALTALGEFGQAIRHNRRATLLYVAPQSGLLAELAYLHATAGNREKSYDLLERLQAGAGQAAPLVSIAQIHTALGNRNGALDCLEQACAGRDWAVSPLKQDYRFDPLRTEPRFRGFLAEIGI